MNSRMGMAKPSSFRSRGLRTILYVVLLAFLLSIVNFLFGWSSREAIPQIMQPYSEIILAVNPYIIYIQAALATTLGYLIVNSISNAVYTYMRRLTDHSTAATIRTVVWISGITILLVVVTSMLSAGPWTALTVGSFGGLVVGFATQSVLSHFIAGIFIILTRPFKFGDVITVAGQTGIVKEMRIMHITLETKDGSTEILIPNGMIFTQIILKKRVVEIPSIRSDEIESIRKMTETAG